MAKKPEPKAKPQLVDLEAASMDDTCRAFGIVKVTLYKYMEKGCPKKEDGTFNIYDVHKWIVNKDKKGGLVEQKLQAEIERIHAQTEKISEQYILREDHERLMNSWASSFKRFWAQAVKKNIIHFCNKELDQLHVIFETFGRQLMEVWADGGTDDKV